MASAVVDSTSDNDEPDLSVCASSISYQTFSSNLLQGSAIFIQAHTSALQGPIVLSDIAALVTKLSELGINGPRHFDQRNISSFGRLLGSGSQFDVYEDSAWNVHEVQRVYKRVKPFALDAKGSDISTSLRARLRTVYLEIASLCHPLRRSNRNIVNLIEWGYDYPTSDLDLRLPLVVMERARAPLDTFLSGQKRSKDSQLARLHHHLSLDISSGLECVHESGLIHGDMKPSNILIFENDQSPVKYTAKLSDFGQCIFLGEDGGGSEAFDLYRGSPCWQPPEIITRDSISAPRASSVLLKADSFAFALVVLSTFLRNGRPLAEEPAGDLGAVRVQCSVDIGHLETSLSMQKMLLSLMETALITEGQSRPDVHPALLACDATSYHEWLSLCCDHSTLKVNKQDRAAQHTSYKYYSQISSAVMKFLEAQYDKESSGGKEVSIAPEALLGMVVGVASKHRYGYRERMIKYALAAARKSSIPAQGIIKRLIDACPGTKEVTPDPSELKLWLINAAQQGSLVAMADLRKLDPESANTARSVFLKNGGYNVFPVPANTSQTMKDIFSAKEAALRPFVAKPADEYGNYLLHYAAVFSNGETLEKLLSAGAGINCINADGETPLYKACLAGNTRAVESLLHFGADASICQLSHSISCLHWLFVFNADDHTSVAEQLIRNGACPRCRTRPVRHGFAEDHAPWEHFPFHWPSGTPFHWATFARSISACDALLHFEPATLDDDDCTDDRSSSHTSLSIAMYYGDSMMVRYLLSRGSDVKRTNARGAGPLHYLSTNDIGLSRLFPMSRALQYVVCHGSWTQHRAQLEDCVRLFKEYGGDLDAQSFATNEFSDQKSSPLIEACDRRNSGPVIALLTSGASTCCVEPQLINPPMYLWIEKSREDLVYSESFEVVSEALLEMTHDVNIRNRSGENLLHRALKSTCDFRYFCELLISHDPPVDLEGRTNQGETPLLSVLRYRSWKDGHHIAVEHAKVLLELGADVEAIDDDGYGFTAQVCRNNVLSDDECYHLIDAQLSSRTERVRQKLAGRSTIKENLTAFMIACRSSLPKTSRLLRPFTDINQITESGLTAYDIALDTAQGIRAGRIIGWRMERAIVWDHEEFCFANTSIDSRALRSRKELLASDAACEVLFRKTITEDYIGSESHFGKQTNIDHRRLTRYFDCMDVLRDLINAGATPASAITGKRNTNYTFVSPMRFDKEVMKDVVEYSDSVVSKQPFWEGHWDLLYKLWEG